MFDPRYARARRVLLDALQALGEHAERVVLIGAQAVYLHTGDVELAIAPFTQDADLAIDPRGLSSDPRIEACMIGAGFGYGSDRQPGRWFGADGVEVDLMVPERLAGSGSRSAEIPPHDKFAARRAAGIEAAIVDNDWHELRAFDPADARVLRARVAGPAALLVAKTIKLSERTAQGGARMVAKDALDVYRILLAVATERLATSLRQLLEHDVAAEATTTALAGLESLFVPLGGSGAACLAAALQGSDEAEIAPAQARALIQNLLAGVRKPE